MNEGMKCDSSVWVTTKIDQMVKVTLHQSLHYSLQEEQSWRWDSWSWNMGVAFYGIYQAFARNENYEYVRAMKEWVYHNLDNIPNLSVNTNAMMLPILLMQKVTDLSPEVTALFQTYDEYVLNDAPRISSGAIAHTTEHKSHSDQVWADTLFMSVIYLVTRGKLLGNSVYIDSGLHQLLLHMNHLRDVRDGLYFHGWSDQQKRHLGVKWGRGNAWIAVSAIELLELASDHPLRDTIIKMLEQQLTSLSSLECPEGGWRTVLDHPDTYAEASVTAGIAYAVMKGIRLGFVDEKHSQMAIRAVKRLQGWIDEEGYVLNGSGGTPILESWQEYQDRECYVTPFTQGLALLALCEYADYLVYKEN
ncbi:glycoside hydrolase family 88 protein [Paenibacillus sp. JSM ZJ436]|uniref:glycoside hydrolase family 88 protein n=1 Tax=Paenibacillus sp. JSM ZJ436 TaxID=3376190 RepID=UPI0037A11048